MRLISRISPISPTLESVFRNAKVTVVDPGFFRTNQLGSQIDALEVLPGRHRKPPHLVFVDDSNEGYRPERYRNRLGTIADYFGVPFDRVVILTQNEEFPTKISGGQSGPDVNASIVNLQFERSIDVARNGDVAARFPPTSPSAYKKTFLILNNKPRPHRIAVMAGLQSMGLLQQTAASFHFDIRNPEMTVEKSLQRARTLFPEHSKSITKFFSTNSFPMILEKGFGRENFWDFPSEARQCLWFLLTESNFTRDYLKYPVRRVTEKSMKALVFGHPFVMVGNPFTIHYLHELGFHTYGRFLDEGFDQFIDPGRRLAAILEVVHELSRKRVSGSLLHGLREVASKNREWLLGGFTNHVAHREARSMEAAIGRAGL